MTDIHRHVFDDKEALAVALAGDVATRLQQAIDERGKATLAVSGGSTPKLFLQTLSDQKLAWDQVTVTLVDERFVPETSERSNQRLVIVNLLQNRAARARFVPLYNQAGTVGDAADRSALVIEALPRPLDVVVLGMGTDGHTASFFPESDRLSDVLSKTAERAVMAIEAPGAGEPRLTLTFPWIATARHLILHIEGEAKRETLAAAEDEGPEDAMPVRAILRRAQTPLHLYVAP